MADEVQHERELREQWQDSHALVHTQEQRARDLAFIEINRRLDDMNELRRQIEIERGTYVRREVYDREHNAMRDLFNSRLDMMRDADDGRLKELENAKSNADGRMWGIGAMYAFLAVIVNLVLRYWGK